MRTRREGAVPNRTKLPNSGISFLPPGAGQEFGKVPGMSLPCSPLPAPTGLQVSLNLVAAAVALQATDRLVLVWDITLKLETDPRGAAGWGQHQECPDSRPKAHH